MARALDSPLDLTLLRRLQGHRDRLSDLGDYELNELAVFVVVWVGDTLEQAESAVGRPLVSDHHFAFLPEFIERQGTWLEATFILSDDGYGLVVLAEEGTAADPRLMQAFRNAAAHNDKAPSR